MELSSVVSLRLLVRVLVLLLVRPLVVRRPQLLPLARRPQLLRLLLPLVLCSLVALLASAPPPPRAQRQLLRLPWRCQSRGMRTWATSGWIR